MFDVGWQELFLIAVVALIVIGPKDLPAAMRTMARVLSKIRGLSREFQQNVSEIMREAELDEIRRKVEQAGRVDMKGEVDRMLDPDGRVRSELDLAADLRPIPADGERTAGDGKDRPGPPPAAAAPRAAYAPEAGATPPIGAPGAETGAETGAHTPAPTSPASPPASDRSAVVGKPEP